MKRSILAVVLLTCLVFGGRLWAANEFNKAEAFSVKDLKVILKQNPTNEIISVQLYLKGGVLNLTESTQGIEAFIFSSSTLKDKKYAEKKWNKIIDGTGAELGSAYGKDFTVVSLRCTRQYFDQLWELFSDYVLKTTFYDERVEIARERMLMRMRQRQDKPDVTVRYLAEEQFYSGHPYRFDPLGVEASLSKISMKQMKSHLKKALKKSRLLLVVVGNVARADLEKKVAKTFGKLSKGKYKQTLPGAVTHTSPSLKVVERDLPTNYILGLFCAPAQTDPDYPAMTIAMDILKWRLFEEIRTKRNLSYAPDAFLSTELASYGGIYATSVQPDSTVTIMLAELKKLQVEPVAAKDLRDRINVYLTLYYLSNESNAAQAQFLARFELSGLGWQEGEKRVEKLRKVTAEDVQRVASQYFKNIQFVVLGDPELIDTKLFTSM